MSCCTLKENERKVLIHLLTQLEKRIYLLRVSLYGAADKYFAGDVLVSKERLEMEDEDFQRMYNLSADDFRLIVDSCEVETDLRRILNEVTITKSCLSLKAIVQEMEEESTSFKKHQKMIEDKRKQIDQLKGVLPVIQEQAEVAVGCLKSKKFDVRERIEEKAESFGELSFLKKLMDYKVESKKNFYEHQKAELEKNIEWYERETRMQAHADVQTVSYWLLKFDDYTEKLDLLLKQMFDNWATKRRELDILRKYRKLNLEKIQKLQKLIQAFWRGTMVRKHLGPYQIKKPKKGKGKKGKGKKKK